MKPLSLYLHIPFCLRKCAYCDFPSWAGREEMISSYISVLTDEIIEAGKQWNDRTVCTVFFGGGTPSILSGEQIASLTSAVRSAFFISPDAEISLEANPGTLTDEKLFAYRRAGINRLSIGAQTLNDRLLRSIGRIHTGSEAVSAVLAAHKAGFRNVNLDLMYGLPGQTIDDFSETIRLTLDLPVQHLSMYSLIVEEGTPLFHRVTEKGESLPDEEETLAMQHMAARLLKVRGFDRYEISNYALPGFECRHNLTYWYRNEYLGLGCASHSMMENTRFSNTASLTEYLSGTRKVGRQSLTDTDVLEETVMLSLRLREGMNLSEYRRLTGNRFPAKRCFIDRLIHEGMAFEKGERLILTEHGMDVLNAIIEALV